jgi:diacylglycerol diphosphate phosphatase/phosphatidate phosphatase
MTPAEYPSLGPISLARPYTQPLPPRVPRMNPKPHRRVQGDGTTDPEAARESQRGPHSRRNAFIPGFHSRPPFKIWLRNNWLDIITQLLCVLAAFMLYILAPPLVPRYFPLYAGIEHSAFGIKYGKPYMSEYITTLVSAIVSYVAPLLVMGGIGLWRSRDFADGNAAVSFPSNLYTLSAMA